MYDIRKHIGQIPADILDDFHSKRSKNGEINNTIRNLIYLRIWDFVCGPFEMAESRVWHQIK